MFGFIKNIFNKNKIGKNDNTDIGNNKNNKIKDNENNVINSLSLGKDDISSLSKLKIKIEDDVFSLKEEIWNCPACKSHYFSIMNNVIKIINNDKLKNSNEWNINYSKYLQIKNWDEIITCNNHKSIAKKIEMKIDQIKGLNYSINNLFDKK